jgi:thiamine kinase-like enzyme
MSDDKSFTKTLTDVLSKALGKPIVGADYRVEQLHGGTLGTVKCFSGTAKAADGEMLPYRVVQKTQKKWDRPGDPDSWRREYDLAVSDFSTSFSGAFCRPLMCYSAALKNGETELWMAYVNGVSGSGLTTEMLEQAAEALGRFQGWLYQNPYKLQKLSCLSDTGFFEREHEQWHQQTYDYEFLCSEECRLPQQVRQMLRDNPWDNGKTIEYNYLRSPVCDLPERLKQMLIGIDDDRSAIFDKLRQLPVVFCHRDFWLENLFYTNEGIVLIDWDSAGFGCLGEDIASLIADDTESDCLHDYYRRLIPAYRRGLSPYMALPAPENSCIWEMMVLKFGYRILQSYLFAEAPDVKQQAADRLQKLYEMRSMQIENC